MKNKDKFIRFYKELTHESRMNLVWKPYGRRPMSMLILNIEITGDTTLGKVILNGMFGKDDKKK